MDYIYIPSIREALENKSEIIKAYCVSGDLLKEFDLTLGDMTDEERKIILSGCLINYNRVS